MNNIQKLTKIFDSKTAEHLIGKCPKLADVKLNSDLIHSLRQYLSVFLRIAECEIKANETVKEMNKINQGDDAFILEKITSNQYDKSFLLKKELSIDYNTPKFKIRRKADGENLKVSSVLSSEVCVDNFRISGLGEPTFLIYHDNHIASFRKLKNPDSIYKQFISSEEAIRAENKMIKGNNDLLNEIKNKLPSLDISSFKRPGGVCKVFIGGKYLLSFYIENNMITDLKIKTDGSIEQVIDIINLVTGNNTGGNA